MNHHRNRTEENTATGDSNENIKTILKMFEIFFQQCCSVTLLTYPSKCSLSSDEYRMDAVQCTYMGKYHNHPVMYLVHISKRKEKETKVGTTAYLM